MSTSLLYHAWGLRGYKHVRTEYRGGCVRFHIRQPRERVRCSRCGSAEGELQGTVSRSFRLPPIGSKPVFLEFPIPRFRCRSCNVVRQVKLPFAEARRSYTRSFERYALELSRRMTIDDVAKHLSVGWDMIKDIQQRFLQRRFGKPKLHKLKRIAIDEIAVGKGHDYLTVVMNLETGAVVFVGDGRGMDALEPFWRRLRRARARIEAVATDMSQAYVRAVRENLPEAVLVFDRFHVTKLFNEKLSNLRRELYRQATDEQHKNVLKGTRWLLLKNPENLSADRNEEERLEEALALNRSLSVAYYLKEDLRQIWEQAGPASGAWVLDDWIRRAKASKIRMLEKFAETLERHREGILAWYEHPISTGPLEGTNNKIQTMKRQAYGFRDREFYKLKIMAVHKAKYALVG